MSFKNIPEHIKKHKTASLDQEAIRIFALGRPADAITHILRRLSRSERVDFYFYALTKVSLRSYKLGIELLKSSIDTILTTQNKEFANDYRKNFTSYSTFDIVANDIITEAISNPEHMDETFSRRNLIFMLYGGTLLENIQDTTGKLYTEALADLLEFKYNNTTFRLMYAKN